MVNVYYIDCQRKCPNKVTELNSDLKIGRQENSEVMALAKTSDAFVILS